MITHLLNVEAQITALKVMIISEMNSGLVDMGHEILAMICALQPEKKEWLPGRVVNAARKGATLQILQEVLWDSMHLLLFL